MTMDERRGMVEPGPVAGPFDAATFRAELGTTFQVVLGTEHIPLRLAEVADGRTGGGFMRFSVLFHGPPDRMLSQGTYEFGHDKLGSLLLFIVPIVGSDAERIVYEACFSHRLPARAEP
jgi:hypothetical protein